MVPGTYLFLPEMPVTVNGKIDRKALPAPEGTAEGAGRSLVPPRDRMEAELVAIWCQALSLEELSVTDHFFDLGGHSLLAVKLMSEVQGRLGVRLDVAELYAAGTVEEMASLLRGRTRTSLPGSLVELAVAPGTAGDTSEAASLVCVHAVDGAAHGYAHLARLLGGATAVYGCQAPGLDDGADLAAEILEDFEALAAYHADALATLLPRGEFILCGWSTGGLLASAMACRLEELGRAPERLILLDTHLARSAEEPSRTESAEETAFETAFAAIGTELGAQREFFAQMLLGPAGAASPDSDSGPDPGDPGDPGDWRSSDLAGSEEAFLRRLSELAVGLGRLPAGAEAAQLERRWQVFRRLVQASSGYRPRPHRCPITLIQAAGVPASIGERQAAACRALTLGPFEVETVAADHHGMLRPEAVFEVADRVARWLRSGKEVAEHATV
jgi:thioesterase domain-containing protein/acyl carrier protein